MAVLSHVETLVQAPSRNRYRFSLYFIPFFPVAIVKAGLTSFVLYSWLFSSILNQLHIKPLMTWSMCNNEYSGHLISIFINKMTRHQEITKTSPKNIFLWHKG